MSINEIKVYINYYSFINIYILIFIKRLLNFNLTKNVINVFLYYEDLKFIYLKISFEKYISFFKFQLVVVNRIN